MAAPISPSASPGPSSRPIGETREEMDARQAATFDRVGADLEKMRAQLHTIMEQAKYLKPKKARSCCNKRNVIDSIAGIAFILAIVGIIMSQLMATGHFHKALSKKQIILWNANAAGCTLIALALAGYFGFGHSKRCPKWCHREEGES